MSDQVIILAARATLTEALRLDWPLLGLTNVAKSWLLGQAWGENRFASGERWKGSNCWGAITHRNFGIYQTWGYIEHADHDANGHPVIYKFQKYPTQLDGARDWLKVIMRGRVPEALDTGTARDMADAMYANRYYTGVTGSADDRIRAYTSLILTNAAHVTDVLAQADSGIELSTTKGLQARLLVLGYDPGVIDGVIGNHTIDAVKRFQLDHGLKPDGIVGPLTRSALRAAISPSPHPI
jgi:hypothetical protein